MRANPNVRSFVFRGRKLPRPLSVGPLPASRPPIVSSLAKEAEENHNGNFTV
jgi:hypothetical protein